MTFAKATLSVFAFLLLSPGIAFAQSSEQSREPVAVVEIGAVPSVSLTDAGAKSFGPTVAVEFTPLEDRLELEAGVTALLKSHSSEWSTDLLFKKPWTLSQRNEFMLGVGPEWIHSTDNGATTNSVGFEIAPDFMFWHSPEHKWGWYVEPSYDYSFGRGHEQSISIAVGLIVGLR